MQKISHVLNNTKRIFKYFPSRCNSTSQPSENSSFEYCVNLVRKLDHDNFVASVMLPPKIRTMAFAIRALNVELSKVQEQTSEHTAGIMRFKFWEDGIDSVYNDNPPNHPVFTELHKAVKKYNLSKLLFKRLLSARLNQLNVSTFKDMEEMENYADHTCSSVIMLLLEAMKVRDVNCDHVASHVGKAQGLTNLIRALPYNLKEKVVLLPRTELLKHDISEESLMRNSVNPDALADVIFKVASKANTHLQIAESLKSNTPPKCRTAFLPAVPVRYFLKDLQKAKFYIYEPKLSRKNTLLLYALLWNRISRSF